MVDTLDGKMWKETQVAPYPLRLCWRNCIKLTIVKTFPPLFINSVSIKRPYNKRKKTNNPSTVLSKREQNMLASTHASKKISIHCENGFPEPKIIRYLNRKRQLASSVTSDASREVNRISTTPPEENTISSFHYRSRFESSRRPFFESKPGRTHIGQHSNQEIDGDFDCFKIKNFLNT